MPELKVPEFGKRTVFFLLALPAMMRAVWRLGRIEDAGALDRLADRLRAVKPFALPYLRNPVWLAGSVDRLTAIGFWRQSGSCWTRSLLLLDLLSRSGQAPRLHLGIARADSDRHFHAWVTVEGKPLGPVTGHQEIWSG